VIKAIPFRLRTNISLAIPLAKSSPQPGFVRMIKLFIEHDTSVEHQGAVVTADVYAIAVFERVFFLLAFFEVGEGGVEDGD
jgi:hypothetical protein